MKRFVRKAGLLCLLCTSVLFSQTPDRLSLNSAIAIAVQSNPDVLAAQKGIEAAAGRVRQAGRIPNPELSVTYNETPTNFSLSDAGEQDIGIFQPVEFPGRRGARVDVAEHEKTISELDFTRAKTVIVSKVKKTYYGALLAKEIIASLELTISLLDDFLKQVTERYQSGASAYLDVIRTKVELTRLRNDLTEAKREQQFQLAELNVLLGRPGETAILLADSMLYEPLRLTQDSAIALYSGQSAFLKIVESEARRSQSLLSLARTSYLPDFDFGFSLQNRPGQISATGSTRYLGFEVGLSLPLWFWQGPKGEVEEAVATVDIATVRVEASRRRVRQSIVNTYQIASVVDQQLQVFETSLLRDAEDELRAGISAYQNNQIDVLNLFDIYRTYRSLRIEYTRALYNYLAAKAELEASAEVPE